MQSIVKGAQEAELLQNELVNLIPSCKKGQIEVVQPDYWIGDTKKNGEPFHKDSVCAIRINFTILLEGETFVRGSLYRNFYAKLNKQLGWQWEIRHSKTRGRGAYNSKQRSYEFFQEAVTNMSDFMFGEMKWVQRIEPTDE